MRTRATLAFLAFTAPIAVGALLLANCERRQDEQQEQVSPPLPAHHVGASLVWLDAGNEAGVDRFVYATGTAGTYVVPTGYYVTSWWAHNTSGGGTVSIAPSGPRVLTACADAAAFDAGDSGAVFDAGYCQSMMANIVIPAASAYGQAIPVLMGGFDEMGDGTQFVFTSTDSYVVTLERYSP